MVVDDVSPLRHLPRMATTKLDLTGLKCPLPALKTRKALKALTPGDFLEVHCTDPLSVIDIPNLIRETGDKVEITERARAADRLPDRKGPRPCGRGPAAVGAGFPGSDPLPFAYRHTSGLLSQFMASAGVRRSSRACNGLTALGRQLLDQGGHRRRAYRATSGVRASGKGTIECAPRSWRSSKWCGAARQMLARVARN